MWGAWEEVATGANNALITSGTNSNGSFTMFPDGTMICQRTSLSSSAGGDITWTFPAVFSSTPATSVIAVNSGDLLLSGNITSSAVSSVSFNIRDVSEGRVTTDVRLTAIGRWKLMKIEIAILILQLIPLITLICSVIAATTETPKDDEFLAKWYKIVDVLALNVGKAKDK